jgi:hypothetical protein
LRDSQEVSALLPGYAPWSALRRSIIRSNRKTGRIPLKKPLYKHNSFLIAGFLRFMYVSDLPYRILPVPPNPIPKRYGCPVRIFHGSMTRERILGEEVANISPVQKASGGLHK